MALISGNNWRGGELKYVVGVLPQVGVWLKPPKIAPLKPCGKGRPPTAARYGD